MDLGLENKIALVTASTAGIGYSIAKALAEEGAQVYINGRSKKTVDAAIEKLQSEGVSAKLMPAPFNAANPKEAEALIKAISGIDILVNNLGLYEEITFLEISDEEWQRIFEINVLSGIRLSRHYLPLMLAQGWGRIVFISSEAAINKYPIAMHYGVTKTSQLAVARGLAELTKGSQTTVNSVLPGVTWSPGVEDYVKKGMESENLTFEEFEKRYFKTVKPTSIIQRFETPEEIAAVVAFVCSQKASAINGAAIHAEGGVIRAIT
jgi:NAD(P)-dependent dehydrogenase (short-subunit alcohol dehydrogenase family)